MLDWATISSLGTAASTLVLAVATFASVRSANRSARVAERSFRIALRPLMMPSRFEDPMQKIRWVDEHWAHIEGGRGYAEVVDGNIYLAMSLRNAGSGMGVLRSWFVDPEVPRGPRPQPDLGTFRPHGRDLYIAPGDIGFWQAAVRDTNDDVYSALRDAIEDRRPIAIDVMYCDHEDEQHTISQFMLSPAGEASWLCSVGKHQHLEQPGR